MRATPATAAAENARPGADLVGDRPDHRAEQRAADGGADRDAEHSPRRSGRRSASQARPAAQVQAPPRPWTNRAASRTAGRVTQPKTSVDTLIRLRPSRPATPVAEAGGQ